MNDPLAEDLPTIACDLRAWAADAHRLDQQQQHALDRIADRIDRAARSHGAGGDTRDRPEASWSTRQLHSV